MLGVNRILVAIDRSDSAGLVVEKAIQLADAADADIEVIRVIYEGVVDLSVHDVEQSQALKTFVMQAEETYLQDLVEPFSDRGASLDCLTLWNKDTWQGIIDAAADFGADLILKAANVDEGLGTVAHTPQDWSLLRQSTVPVMMLKPDAWVEGPSIFAAIDAIEDDQQELNRRILLEASNLTRILRGKLHIIAAYPITEPWGEPPPSGIDFKSVKQEVEGFVKTRAAELVAATGIEYNYLYVEEGNPAMVIEQFVDDTEAEVLVMGTVARTGVRGVTIGNTSETIIHHTNCDVVVIR